MTDLSRCSVSRASSVRSLADRPSSSDATAFSRAVLIRAARLRPVAVRTIESERAVGARSTLHEARVCQAIDEAYCTGGSEIDHAPEVVDRATCQEPIEGDECRGGR